MSTSHINQSPQDIALQRQLDAVASQAVTTQRLATAGEWARHQQHLHSRGRQRRQRRVAGLSIAAACSVVAAGLGWSTIAGRESTVQVVPGGPVRGTVSDQDAQVRLLDPAALGASTSLPQPFKDLARGCAAQGGVGGRGGDYIVVMAGRSALSQAVAVRDDSGKTWLCSYLPGAQTAGQVFSGDGGANAVANGAVTGGVGRTVDGSVMLSYFGYANPEVAAVTVTTPTGTVFPAVVSGGVWWATPRVADPDAAANISWQAFDAHGVVIAGGVDM